MTRHSKAAAPHRQLGAWVSSFALRVITRGVLASIILLLTALLTVALTAAPKIFQTAIAIGIGTSLLLATGAIRLLREVVAPRTWSRRGGTGASTPGAYVSKPLWRSATRRLFLRMTIAVSVGATLLAVVVPSSGRRPSVEVITRREPPLTRPAVPPVAFYESLSGCTAAISTDLLFEFDSADVRPEGRDILAEVGRVIREARAPVIIEGYTDGTGPAEYNLELSRQRALAVAAVLRSSAGSDVEIDVRGFGESGAVDNVSSPDRRRVVVSLPVRCP